MNGAGNGRSRRPRPFDPIALASTNASATATPRTTTRRAYSGIARILAAGGSTRREGRHYWCRVSGGGSVVLVDEAAEPVAAADRARR